MNNVSARGYLRERKWTTRRPRASGVTSNAGLSPSYRGPHEAVSPSSLILTDSPDAGPYEYLPLNRTRKEIRLLILEPGPVDEMLYCTLKHVFLDSSPPPFYETISYVCGDPTRKRMIMLHGHETPAMVTSEAALHRMRLNDHPRILWIDSICINQDDRDEKGHQIGMMYETYTMSFRNLVWMGRYNRTWAPDFDALRAMQDEIVAETRDYADFYELLSNKNGTARHSEKPFSAEVQKHGFDFLRLFDCPWFSRLWIVQEATLAPSSVCYFGEFDYPLIDILRCARWLWSKRFHLPPRPGSRTRNMMNAAIIATVADRKFGQFHIKNGSCMSNCLAQFKYLGAFDRKDHVYAILGLWQFFTKATMLPDVLKPDYTLSVCEVFTRATRFAIEESQRLHIMERVSESPPSSSWPSWVPVLYDSGYGKARSFFKAASYKADGSVRVIIQDGAERPDALVLSGFSVSSIAKVTPICIPRLRGTRKEAMTAMACCDSWDECHEDGFEAKISLVLIDGTQQGRKVTTQQALRGYRSLKEHLQDNESFPPKRDTPAGIYWSSFRVAARSRAVFLTENGHIGVGPQCSQAGDIVAILYGSRLPMGMRPLPQPDSFRLLGASHVYGIMKGEAVRRHKDMGVEDTVFRIL